MISRCIRIAFGLLVLKMVLPCEAIAQMNAKAIREPKFQSPNSSSLGKYGDVPVSYHTGVAEITVPIFTVQEGNLQVPITLSYHSNGIRVDEVAGWVGLGWSLNAGGSIARTIMGGPDEGKTNTYEVNSSCGITGWYRNYGMPSCLNLNSTDCPNINHEIGQVEPGSGRGAGLEYTCYNIYMAASHGTIDTEPDLYSYNVPGLSGKFLFDANRKAHMTPEEDIYIKPEESPVLFNTWKIIGTDGTKYFFGGAGATESTYSTGGRALTPLSDNKTSTTWYLTKIESANGEHWIAFEYEAEQSSYCTKATQTYIRASAGETGSYLTADGSSITGTDGWRISKITTSSGYTTVDFIESTTARTDLTSYSSGFSDNTSARSLSKIQITYGPNCKSFTLNTTYFNYTGSSNYGSLPIYAQESKRLKLLSIQEATCDNSIILQPHQFFYEEGMELPRRGSFSQDHWGYYNGKPNTALLPPFTDPTNGQQRPGADRSSDFNFMKIGMLKQIVYPTGGFTNFTYEAHKETPSSSTIIGGLRIASIVDNDGFGNTVTKNYSYPQGILYTGTVSYAQYPNMNSNVAPGSNWNIYDFGTIFTSAPNPPMQSTQGYHIGYSVVEVSSPGNGKSIYRFYNTYPTTYGMSYPRTPTVAVIGTGLLYSEEHLSEAGAPIKSTSFVYDAPGSTTSITAKKVLAINPQNSLASPQYPYPMWNNYTITTYRNRLKEKIETIDGISTTTSYTYDPSHNSPKTTQFVDSRGSARKTEFIYPGEAGSGAPQSMYNPVPESNFKNMQTTPVEERTFVDNSLKKKVVSQFTESGSRLMLTSTKVYPTGTTDFQEDQYQYDANSNLTTVIKSGGVNKAFLWGYKNKYPIASVENAVLLTTPNAKTAPFGVTVTTNKSSCTSILGSLVLNESQTITFTSSVALGGATGLWIKLTMKNASGNPVFGPRLYNAAGSYPESVALAPGTYTFCYESGNYPAQYSGYSAINFIVSYNDGLRSNLLHTSFEENSTNLLTAHSGSKVWNGSYSVVMPHVNGAYELTYWSKPTTGATDWALVEVPINISSPTTADYVIGNSSTYIDDIRLYPKGALMTTYCYTPGNGMTSSADPNQVSSFYEYDTMGRLLTIKGDKRNILKTYQYHYKGQN